MIQRGISKFSAAYGGVTVNMQNFMEGQRKKLATAADKA